MGVRSKVSQLPDPVRRELEQRLIGNGFANYDGLAEWLQSEGYQISRASVHRFGATFEDRVRALQSSTEQARAIVEASPDDDGAMNEALLRLTQQMAFDLLIDLQVDPDSLDFPKLVRAIADMNRSSVGLKRYQAEVREKMKSAAADVRRLAEGAGVSDETMAKIDARLQGVC